MISYNTRFSRYCWFAQQIPWYGFLTHTQYHAYLGEKPHRLYHSEPMYTSLLSLQKLDDQYLASLSKKTRYEINRAERDGITFSLHEDSDYFLSFYNDFALSKNLPLLSAIQLSHLPQENLCFTKALNASTGETLVMHCYLYDAERTRLLFSCSHFRSNEQQSLKNLIGMANRYLHFQDIQYFKQQGLSTYDLGGIAYQTKEPALQQINHFKAEFSGQLETSYLVLPRWLHSLKKLRSKR